MLLLGKNAHKLFIVEDWAGNRMFPHLRFETFENAWEHIRTQFPNENDWQEYEVTTDVAPF